MVVFYLCIFLSFLSLTPKEYVDRTCTVGIARYGTRANFKFPWVDHNHSNNFNS
jgi:hypothetical protein